MVEAGARLRSAPCASTVTPSERRRTTTPAASSGIPADARREATPGGSSACARPQHTTRARRVFRAGIVVILHDIGENPGKRPLVAPFETSRTTPRENKTVKLKKLAQALSVLC